MGLGPLICRGEVVCIALIALAGCKSAAPGGGEPAAGARLRPVNLVLVTIDGLSHTDAAQILGCPEGTVAWRVHEARRKLRVFLEARGYQAEEQSS